MPPEAVLLGVHFKTISFHSFDFLAIPIVNRYGFTMLHTSVPEIPLLGAID